MKKFENKTPDEMKEIVNNAIEDLKAISGWFLDNESDDSYRYYEKIISNAISVMKHLYQKSGYKENSK